jgi:hypothetical protein
LAIVALATNAYVICSKVYTLLHKVSKRAPAKVLTAFLLTISFWLVDVKAEFFHYEIGL